MPTPDHPRVLVIGAGVLGSAIALDLARHGARVQVADPDLDGVNASRVAAGMLAPVMEAVLDPASTTRFELLLRARDLWPRFAEGTQLAVHRCGAALFAATPDEYARFCERLGGLGIAYDELQPEAARGLAPGLCPPGRALFTGEDWRVDPNVALEAMRLEARNLGAQFIAARLESLDECPVLTNGARPVVDAVVLATGLAPANVRNRLDELTMLQPIKGQLVSFPGSGPSVGAIVRAPGGYAVPGAGGLVVGATMEEGSAGLEPDPAATARFVELGRQLYPALAVAHARSGVGVRAATPDGLPMVGASSRDGVFLALGARRNGWLLAPLVAQVLRAALGGAKDPLFDPARFLSRA